MSKIGVVVFVLALAVPTSSGCSASQAQAPAATSGGSASSPPPIASGTEAPTSRTPRETPEQYQRRAEAALGRVAAIQNDIAKLRGLPLVRAVPTRYQPWVDFQAFVRSELARDLPPAKSRDYSVAFAHIGLLDKPVDIATAVEQATVAQMAAYYDPRTKFYSLVLVPTSEQDLDGMSAHELVHAVADQTFDLQKFVQVDGKVDEDAESARRFVVEGDATFVMSLYPVRSLLENGIPPQVLAGVGSYFSAAAQSSIADHQKAAKSAAVQLGIPAEVADAIDKVPTAVIAPVYASYLQGALVALAAYQHGGWPAVDQLYLEPPTSTEQVLHPETKLIPTREEPRKVALAKSGDAELVHNVMGELQWRIYFDLWKVPNAAAIAAGWGGDRYAVTRRKDDKLVGRFATIWDSEADAAEFAAGYVASIAARFPGADIRTPETGISRPDGGAIFVRTLGTRVFIVDGAADVKAIDALVRTTKIAE